MISFPDIKVKSGVAFMENFQLQIILKYNNSNIIQQI